VHLHEDVAAADELALNKHLRRTTYNWFEQSAMQSLDVP
jgi:hypothetical protein